MANTTTPIPTFPEASTSSSIFGIYLEARRTMEARLGSAVDALRTYRDNWAATLADQSTRPEILDARRDDFRAQVTSALDGSIAKQTTERAALIDTIEGARRKPQPVDPAAWDRLRYAIEGQMKVGQDAFFAALERLKEAARVGDQAMPVAGRMMLPDYLASTGNPIPDGLRDMLDVLVSDPEIRTAAAIEEDAGDGSGYILTSLELIRMGVDPYIGPIGIGPAIVLWDGSSADLSAKGQRLGLPAGLKSALVQV
jgi:hypothetical protein